MVSKYSSPFSVGKRQTIFIDPADPRVSPFKAGITSARIGSEVNILSANGISQSGTFSHLRNAGPGSQPNEKPFDPTNPDLPGGITNLSAAWEELSSGPALVIAFDFNFADAANKYVNSFIYDLTGSGQTTPNLESKTFNKTSTGQRIEFTYGLNTTYYGLFQTTFSELNVTAYDSFGNPGPTATLTDIPAYNAGLCTPVITATSIIMGYSVDWEDCPTGYESIAVEEVVSDASTAPTTGYQEVYISKIKPATILTPTTEARWVRARFTSRAGTYGTYSNSVKVTPTNPISVDLTPPNEVTAVTGVWSGDNVVISYTLPTTDPGVRFQVALTAPNSSVGYFYLFPVGSGSSQTATITKSDLFNQFGSHFSSFTGIFRSVDASDNRSSGVSFTVAERPNPLLGITPTFTTTALVNGYSVSFELPAAAVYAQIYQKYTTWSGVTPIDSFTGTFASGGASGTNTVTLSNVLSNKGVAVTTIPTGYRVIGNGIPNNTYITSVLGNQITVNNNFTSQVSGSVTGYANVYSGISPANISSTIYENTHLIIRYYDDFENPSNYSAEQIVVPFSPVTVDLTGPGNVSSSGMSTTAGIDTSGTLGFNGYINLSWSAVTESSIRGYRIRYTTDTVSPVYSYVDYPIDQNNIPSGTLSYKLAGLAVGATYKIAIATYDQYNNTSTNYISFSDTAITGTPSVSSYIETTNGFQIGAGVGGGSNQGIYLNTNNYWYLTSASSASLKVGGSNTVTQNTSGSTSSGQALIVLSSVSGVLVGQTVTGSLSIPPGTTVTRIVGNTITVSNNLTGTISNATTLTFSGVFTGLSWNGSNFSVDGDLNARGGSFSGNIALSTPGASIYNGTITAAGALSGNGFIFNKDGLIIRNGTNQISLDTATGSITANAGNIAGWTIDASNIQKQDPSSTKYAGLSSAGTYKFWAGSTSSGGDTTEFAVNGAGKVWAKDIQISGGSLDIGGGSSLAVSATGTSGQSTISVSSASGISTGMLVFGTGIGSGATVSLIAGTTITLTKANSATVSGSIRFVPSSGAHITSSGDFYAANGSLNGNITAKSGTIEGNFQVVSGSFFTGTSPTETSVIINDKGLASIGASNATLTAILNTPITSGTIPMGDTPSVGTLPSQITFFTKAALIGGWVVDDTSIRDKSQQFILDSTNKKISITGVEDVSTTYTVRLGTDLTNALTGTPNIFEAGTIVGSIAQKPNVYITRTGILYANAANLKGTLTVNDDSMKFGDNVDGNLDGLYINATNYWYSNGNFKVGNSISATLTSVTIGGNTTIKGGEITLENTGSLESDNNNNAGDSTLTLNTSNKITLGRRFIYNGTSDPAGTAVPSWDGSTGTYTPSNGSVPMTVKKGDILFVAEV